MAVSVGEIEATLRLKDELTAQLAKAETSMKQFGQTSESVNKLISKFGGGDAIRSALDYVEAVQRVGGVTKLTVKEQQELAGVLQAANDKFKALGVEAPAALQKLTAQTTTLKGGLTGIGEAIAGGFKNLGPTLLAAAGGFVAALVSVEAFTRGIQAAVQFVRESISEYIAAEKAQRKLTAALQAQNTATPETIAAFRDLANQFQNTTVFSDDLITEMQQLLVTVGRVMPSEMGAALEASTNLASGLGIDLRQATMLVAKSFEDNFTTLKRYGVEIDEARAKSEGMTYVLGQLNAKFGGQAAADVRTFSGLLDQLANDFDNVKEAVGELILNNNVFRLVLSAVREQIQEMERDVKLLRLGLALLGGLPGPVGVAFRLMTTDVKTASDQLAETNARVAEFNRMKFGDALLKDWTDYTQVLKKAKDEVAALTPEQRANIQAAQDLNKDITGLVKAYGLSADAVQILSGKQKDNKKVVDESAKAYREWAKAVTGAKVLEEIALLETRLAKLTKAGELNERALKAIAKEASVLGREAGFLPPKLQTLVNQFEGFNKEVDDAIISVPKLDDKFEVSGQEIREYAARVQGLNKDIAAFNKMVLSGKPSEIMKGLPNILDVFPMEAPAKTLGQKVMDRLREAANAFPDMLANAIIHGKGIAEAVSSVLVQGASDVGQAIGESLAKSGSQLSKFLGSAFGALGAIGGQLLGKAFNAIININKNVTKESREAFAKSMGFDNLGKLYDDLRKLGAQGQQLANIGLNIIGRKDEAANRKWMKDVQGFYDMIQKEIGEVEKAISRTDILWTREMQTFIKNSPAFAEAIKGQLNSALGGLSQFLSSGSDLLAVKSDEMAQAIGGTIAAVFDKLRSSGVGMKAALEAVQPALDALDAQLKKAGLDGGEALGVIRGMLALVKDEMVGPFLSGVEGAAQALLGLNNAGLLNQATFSALTGSIGEAFALLVSQGKDADQLLRLMSGPLQTIWELQKDFGFAVDEATAALLAQAEAAGLVGEKQRDPMERMIKSLDRMTYLLEQIAIKFGAIPSEADKAAKGIDNAFAGKVVEVPIKFKWGKVRPPEDMDMDEPQLPGLAGGTKGQYLDFGSGTPVMLHGRERVMTEDESAGGGGMMQPIIINLDGLKFLEVMARTAHRHGAAMPLTYS